MTAVQVLRSIAAVTLSLAAAATWAQASPSAEAAAPAASAPAKGRHMGPRHGGAAGTDYTWGWSMMTKEEREAHQKQMREMQNKGECMSLMEQHHQQMLERAKTKGQKMPASPRRDACAGMKP